MIKGVNKQILEVTNTGSPYFEKIIFFVKPESQQMSTLSLQKEAEKISKEMRKPPKSKKTARQISAIFAYISMGVGAGAALTFLLNNFIVQ